MPAASPHRSLGFEPSVLPSLARAGSPRLLVLRDAVDRNIRRMREELEAVAPGTGFEHLTPHVKTTKSRWAVRRLLDAGVRRFKCTPNELDLLLDEGCRQVLVAYPALPAVAERIARAVRELDASGLCALVGHEAHAAFLAEAAERYGVTLPVMLDLDVGQRRTGAPPGRAVRIARAVATQPRYERLELRGLHAYDGHNHASDPTDRRRTAEESMARVLEVRQALAGEGIRVRHVVAGGTPAFREDLEILLAAGIDAEIEVSPGTWVYHDTRYEEVLPGRFELAALVLCRVLDRPADELVTLDAGHKRWAIDQGPVELFSAPGLEFVSASEEHTVLRRSPDAPDLAVGEPLLVAPRHVCATVNLWERFTLVGPQGEALGEYPVEGRNR